MTTQVAKGGLSVYQALIQDATGVTDLEHIERIEDTMRNVVFIAAHRDCGLKHSASSPPAWCQAVDST